MRSRSEWRCRCVVVIRAFVVSSATLGLVGVHERASAAQAATQQESAAAAQTNADTNRTPTGTEISQAVTTLLTDPNLSGARTMKTLRWKDRSTPRLETPGWLRWFRDLGRWLDQSARYLVWVAVGLAALFLSIHLARLWSMRVAAREADAFIAPTHVGELDIRPEGLPSDIGAAAKSLWDQGQHRVALALLYRGLLSRLAHVHRVPIRDSTTEGDCLRLTAERVPGSPHDYATRLVRVWQLAVYGHAPASDSVVHMLCDEFASAVADMSSRPLPSAGTVA